MSNDLKQQFCHYIRRELKDTFSNWPVFARHVDYKLQQKMVNDILAFSVFALTFVASIATQMSSHSEV